MSDKIKQRGSLLYDLSSNKSYNNPNKKDIGGVMQKAQLAAQLAGQAVNNFREAAKIAPSKESVGVNNSLQSASSAEELLNNWNSQTFANTHLTSKSYDLHQNVFGPFSALGKVVGSIKAQNQAKKDNIANNIINSNIVNKGASIADTLEDEQIKNMQQNIFDLGGSLFNRGATYDSGLQLINEGGTHESNPNEGVPIGIAEDGNPNLVEEGEVIYNDYVFSNRLNLTEDDLKKANLPTKYKNSTFAYVAEKIGKDLIETPTDNLERSKVDNYLQRLAKIQEEKRAELGKKGTQQLKANGGYLYSGEDDLDAYLDAERQSIENDINPTLNSMLFTSPIFRDTLKSPANNLTISDKTKNILKAPATYSDPGLSGIDNIKANSRKYAQQDNLSSYAPVINNIGLAAAALLQNPDYTNAELMEQYADNIPNRTVTYKPLNDYIKYTPMDRNYMLNQLKSQAGAARSSIMNSGNNASSVMANLQAANYNSQNAVINNLMQMEQYNNQLKTQAAEFNRGTNQANSQLGLQAAATNAQIGTELDKLRQAYRIPAAQIREGADTALNQARTKALQDIGTDAGKVSKYNSALDTIEYLAPLIARGFETTLKKDGGKLSKKYKTKKK